MDRLKAESSADAHGYLEPLYALNTLPQDHDPDLASSDEDD